MGVRNEVVAMIFFFSPHQLQDRLAHIHAQTTHPSTLLTPPSRPPDRSLPSINSNSVVILSFHVCFLFPYAFWYFIPPFLLLSISKPFIFAFSRRRTERKKKRMVNGVKNEERRESCLDDKDECRCLFHFEQQCLDPGANSL